MALQVTVITVSDRCTEGVVVDRSGPAVCEVLARHFHVAHQKNGDVGGSTEQLNCASCATSFSVVRKVVPDDVEAIQQAVLESTDEGHHLPSTTGATPRTASLVITTGGTGFAPRDVTPEAVRPLLEKEAPSLATMMLLHSLPHCPSAWLSRAVAGVRGSSLIITLPGSPAAASECLEPLLRAGLPHALDLLCQTPRAGVHPIHAPAASSCTQVVGGGAGCRPLCSVNSGVVTRPRHSAFPIVSMEVAMDLIKHHTQAVDALRRGGGAAQPPVDCGHCGEWVPLWSCVGRTLLGPVVAGFPLPPFRASTRDGYAVVAADGCGTFPVVAALVAGDDEAADGTACGRRWRLRTGEVCRVTTGGPIPEGADAVVQVEDTSLVDADAELDVELAVHVHAAAARGKNIRPVGSDIAEGQCVLQAGQSLGPAEVAVAASVGATTLLVLRRPRVAVMSTGTELADATSPAPALAGVAGAEVLGGGRASPTAPPRGKVFDSNRPMLLAAVADCGAAEAPWDAGIAVDTLVDTRRVVLQALRSADVVISSGGVSMGETDVVKQVITELGGVIHFGRVNIKPGKPTTFATFPDGVRGADGDARLAGPRLFFALPGNPASALVTFHLFVVPALQWMAGGADVGAPVPPPGGPHTAPAVPAASCRPGPCGHCSVSSLLPQGLSAAAPPGEGSAAWWPRHTSLWATALHDLERDPERPEYHRCVVRQVSSGDGGATGNHVVAHATGSQASSRVLSLAQANGLAVVAAGSAPLRRGEVVEVLMIRGLPMAPIA